MLRKSREEILKDFKAQVAQGKILVGVGGEFFPQAAHNGLLDGDRETGCFHSGRG